MGEIHSSPMLDQYRKIKHNHHNDVLFFRLGDFYEMFAEDAIEISALLNLTLTSRNGLPMCGIPYHAARSYISRLLKHGKKIAICEQVSPLGKGQKLMERQVVEVITPGTTVDEDYLDRGNSNYLGCLSIHEAICSFAYIDLSTGAFYSRSFPSGQPEIFSEEIERLQLKELIIQESILEDYPNYARIVLEKPSLVLNRWADWLFSFEKSKKLLENQFRLAGLKSFGLGDNSSEIISAGAILDYINDTAKSLLGHIQSIKIYSDSEFVGIDESSQRNLELVRNLRDGDVHFSLLEILDETKSAMGKRLLRRRLLHPLRHLDKIQKRLDFVETLYKDQGSLGVIRRLLSKIPDIERLTSRLAMDRAHGKDMLAIKDALLICRELDDSSYEKLNVFFEDADSDYQPDNFLLAELEELLQRGICEDPSVFLTEGNLIRSGYNNELDEFRKLHDCGRQLLESYLEEEKVTTGITSLKIRYNRLIGYFFEVTKSQLDRVPNHFIRRQGIVGGERFSTEKLAKLESDINGAVEKIIELEKKLFIEIREKAKKYISQISAKAHWIAELDAAQSLATAASRRGWVRPVLDDSNTIEILESRHPVVEAYLGRGEFIPNDIILSDVFFAMITGPNMAGKSTYLRQAALSVIMAQMGSFIPAKRGRIGLCDRIYCRVGASDNLAKGESTFLVEMNETAYILNTASEKSLVIMDEIGRGTSTNDGLSIAWAVCEELLNRIKCRTFFATHYHELSLLSHHGLVNRSMKVLEKDSGIIFLRKLQEGPTAESYGIHVASLAGLSKSVLLRAKEIMEKLNEKAGIGPAPKSTGTEQDKAVGDVLRDLQELDPDNLTPFKALGLISKWKQNVFSKESPLLKKPSETNPSLFD